MKVPEYRVETYAVRKAEAEMNRKEADGWHVIAICSNQSACFCIFVTYERKRRTPVTTEMWEGCSYTGCREDDWPPLQPFAACQNFPALDLSRVVS